MPSLFLYPNLGGIFMWNILIHFLTFTGGMSAGVVLMCLLQSGKQADEEFEQLQRRTEQ
jgi:hypothetical protein